MIKVSQVRRLYLRDEEGYVLKDANGNTITTDVRARAIGTAESDKGVEDGLLDDIRQLCSGLCLKGDTIEDLNPIDPMTSQDGRTVFHPNDDAWGNSYKDLVVEVDGRFYVQTIDGWKETASFEDAVEYVKEKFVI